MRIVRGLVEAIIYLSVSLIFLNLYDVGLFGVLLIAIVAGVFNLCGYIEGVNGE